MKWEWIRRLLIIGGAIYVWSLVPIGFRPQIVKSPLKKSEQTVVVEVENRDGVLGPSAVAKVKSACRAPLLARIVMSSADSARLILTYNRETIGTRRVLCATYLKSST